MKALRLLGITALLGAALFALAGCSGVVANTFENEKDPRQTMELVSENGVKMWFVRNVHDADFGNFTIRKDAQTMSGRYSRHDNTLELKDLSGSVQKLTMSADPSLAGYSLRDEHGEVWRHKSQSKSLRAAN